MANPSKTPQSSEKVSPALQDFSFTENPGIEIRYGKTTWQATQSVVDIIQNHLDASTSAYEKKLLESVGIETYLPNSESQQMIISTLAQIRSEPHPGKRLYIYGNFNSQNLPALPECEELATKLATVHSQLPLIQIKVSDGTASRWVAFEKADELSHEWKIDGFRIHDNGPGFDHELLGIMGASTKDQSTTKRGGLGEGLKMSITHLLREHVRVRLLSKTPEGIWMSEPEVRARQVFFPGKHKPTTPEQISYGSITEVDFSNSKVSEDLQQELRMVFDPRLGEGLKKYILDYHEQVDSSLIDITAELCSKNVPGGRIYVRGLLVDSQAGTSMSYNLKDKWAISGRDRKTVRSDAVQAALRFVVENSHSPSFVANLVSAISTGESCAELNILSSALRLNEAQRALWREHIEEQFDFTPGKNLFVSGFTVSDQERYANENGFEIVQIPAGLTNVIYFFESIYPNVKVSLRQVSTYDRAPVMQDDLLMPPEDDVIKVVKETFEPLPDSTKSFVETVRNKFLLSFVTTFTEDFADGVYLPMNIEKLLEIEFLQGAPSSYHAGNVYYRQEKNQLVFTTDFPLTPQGEVSLFLAFTKIACERNVFDTLTQDFLTRLAGRPTRSELSISEFSKILPSHLSHFDDGHFLTYKDDQKLTDREQIMFVKLTHELNTNSRSRDETEGTLEQLRQCTDSSANKMKMNHLLTERIFHWNGEFFEIPQYSLQLQSFSFDENSEASPIEKTPEENEKPDWKQNAYDYLARLFETRIDRFDTSPLTQEDPIHVRSPLLDEYDFTSSVNEDLWSMPGVDSGEQIELLNSSMPGISSSTSNRKQLSENATSFSSGTSTRHYLPLQLSPGEGISLKFQDGENEYSYSLLRRGNVLVAKCTHDEHTKETFFANEQTLYAGPLSFHAYNSVLVIDSRSIDFEVNIEHTHVAHGEETLPEINTGNEFLQTSVNLGYGVQVWNNPRRILLDAVQNHIDADTNVSPTVLFTVIDREYRIHTAYPYQMREQFPDRRIIGVSISDVGDGYSTSYLSVLGSTTKGDEHIGKFGEGLKMLAASCVRQGIAIEFRSRNWKASAGTFQKTVNDYETGQSKTFDLLGYDLEWSETHTEGSTTRFSIVDLQNDQKELTPVQRAQVDNLFGTRTEALNIWDEWMIVLDPRRSIDPDAGGLKRYVLEGSSPHTDGIVTVYPDRGGEIYEKNLLVTAQEERPMLFGYNVKASLINTRERNAYDKDLLKTHVHRYYGKIHDKDIIRMVLQKLKEDPDTEYFEYGLLGGDPALWRQTYYEVFGENAILSLKPLHIRASRATRMSWGLLSMESFSGVPSSPDPLYKYVANEAHLENENLVVLPESVTLFLEKIVYTSKNYTNELNSSGVELSEELHQKLYQSLLRINKVFLSQLDFIENSEFREELYSIITADNLEKRKSEIQNLTSEQISVLHRHLPVEGAIAGNVSMNKSLFSTPPGSIAYKMAQKPFHVSLNERILNDVDALTDTYIHELAHYISGRKDYSIEFNRFLMLLAIAGRTEDQF